MKISLYLDAGESSQRDVPKMLITPSSALICGGDLVGSDGGQVEPVRRDAMSDQNGSGW